MEILHDNIIIMFTVHLFTCTHDMEIGISMRNNKIKWTVLKAPLYYVPVQNICVSKFSK